MKAFCLEKALAGSPVMLKNGCKGFIKFEIPSRYNFAPSSALGGYWINNRDVAITENWRINGTHFDDSNLNIIGMYEESNNYESNQMKKFDLEKALAGEPVRLRDGSKAFVMFRKPEKLVFTHDTELVGYVISGIHAVTQSWSINGLYQENEESDADIVGMWEEPRPTVTLTPLFVATITKLKVKSKELHLYHAIMNLTGIQMY